MLKIKIEKGFKKDIERDKNSGKYNKEDFNKLKSVIKSLQEGKRLEKSFKRHKLSGKLKGYESIHIKNDWLLIFKIDNSYLTLVMLGSHSQVYK